MATLGHRIKKARTEAGLSQQALADAISQLGSRSISRTAIAQWESGATREIEASNLLRASKVLSVTPDWLQFGIGNMNAGLLSVPSSIDVLSNIRSVPLLDYRQVTKFMDDIKNEIKQDIEVSNIGLDRELAEVAGPSVFALTVKNNSMAPVLKPGDIVVIDPDVKPHPGEIVAAKILKDDVIILRKYRPLEGHEANATDGFELIAHNQDWPKVVINNENQGFIIGTLIEHRCRRRLNREVSETNDEI